MNRTKVITIVAIVVGVVALAVGFAAFQQSLTISSSAAVNPTNTFGVVFSSSGTSISTTAVEPIKSVSEIIAENATINNVGTNPTISNLAATFTEPGQSVTYEFYAANTGEYDAYLNGVIFNNVEGQNSFKVCTPGIGAASSLVSSACNSIMVEVKVAEEAAKTTTGTYENHLLSKGMYEKVVVTIKYANGGTRADGPFSVSFGDISLEYSTVGNAISGGTLNPENLMVISSSTNSAGVGGILPLNLTGPEIVKISNATYRTTDTATAATLTYTFTVQNTSLNDMYLTGFEPGYDDCEANEDASAKDERNTCKKFSYAISVDGEEYVDFESLNKTIAAGETFEISLNFYYEGEGLTQFLNVTFGDFRFGFRNTLEPVTNPKIGDVDGDGILSFIDAQLLERKTSGWESSYYAPAIYIDQVGDVDCDGVIGAMDSLLLSRYANGWDPETYADAHIGEDSCPVTE